MGSFFSIVTVCRVCDRTKLNERKKKGMKEKKKKKNVPDRREKEKRKVFSTPFLSFPFQIKILVKESALLSALLRFSFFSLGVFIRRTSRWSRACIYISKRAISTSFSRDETRKREKERKRKRDDDPTKKGRGRRKIESFFRSGRLSKSERRREKEREEERLSSSFQTLY